jgi:hypothetical protein
MSSFIIPDLKMTEDGAGILYRIDSNHSGAIFWYYTIQTD